MSFPAAAGFPYTVRLPLGVVRSAPPSWVPGIVGTPIDEWEADNLPPGAISNPYTAYRDLVHGLEELRRVAELLTPVSP